MKTFKAFKKPFEAAKQNSLFVQNQDEKGLKTQWQSILTNRLVLTECGNNTVMTQCSITVEATILLSQKVLQTLGEYLDDFH